MNVYCQVNERCQWHVLRCPIVLFNAKLTLLSSILKGCGLRVMHHLQREHEVLACLKPSLNAASPEKARKYMLFKTVDACFAPAAHLYTRFARAAHDMNEP